MPDRMPDRMPEDMSDRMPEDLPVRKSINVMVGITRSKVIAVWGNVSKVLHIFHQNTSNFIETHQKTMVFLEARHRSNLRGQPGQYGTRDSREKR